MNANPVAPWLHEASAPARDRFVRRKLRGPRPPPSAPEADEHRPVVLLVEDVEVNQQLLEGIFTGQGYVVHAAANGDNALARIAAHHPDVILLDLMLPLLNGIEVCRRLKSDPSTAHLPVVLLAAADRADLTVKALHAGAADFILKPFNPAELLARVHTHVELKRTRDELQHIIAMKSDLMAFLAHDLKNPIGAVRFSAHMLRDEGVRAPDPRGELVEAIIDSSESVLAFINDRLEESACVARLGRMAMTEVDLVEVVQADLKENWPAATRKGIGLMLAIPGKAIAPVRADKRALSRVLNNLLSNAIKFSPPGHPVHIAIECVPGGRRVRLNVRDCGPGLTADDCKHLFMASRRLSARPTAGESSTGLCLSIAYDLMKQKMGGEIGCDSRPGEGACFWITLALARTPGADVPLDHTQPARDFIEGDVLPGDDISIRSEGRLLFADSVRVGSFGQSTCLSPADASGAANR